MDKNQKYKELAIIFFKRLILIEKETSKIQKELEKISKTNIIQLSLDTADIVPLLEVEYVMELEEDKKVDLMYEEFSEIVNKEDVENIYDKIENFIEKYI